MKSFGVVWFIIWLDKSTVIKGGSIGGSPLNVTTFLVEFEVPSFRFLLFKDRSNTCSAPWPFLGIRGNSFLFWVGEIWLIASSWIFLSRVSTGAERLSQVGAWHEGARTTVVVYLQKYDLANRSTLVSSGTNKNAIFNSPIFRIPVF